MPTEDKTSRKAVSKLRKEVEEMVTEHASKTNSVDELTDLSTQESELLKQINQGLPEDLARRLEALISRRQAEALTDDEQTELIRLGDEAERLEASRVKALAELATARRTTLPRLMQEMGLTPAGHG